MDPKSIPVTDANNTEANTAPAEGASEAPSAPPVNMDVTPPPTDTLMSDESAPEALQVETEGPATIEPSETVTTSTAVDGPVPAASASNSTRDTADMQKPSDSPVNNDKPAKKSSKTMMIAVAVGLAVVLAAVAILLFLKNKDATKKTVTTGSVTPASSQTSPVDKTPVTSADVDTATKQVDSTVTSLDNNKDFGADAMSDKSLGL